MNKTVKILIMLLVAICIISVASVSFANSTQLTPGSLDGKADVDSNVIKSVGNQIFTIIRNIAAVASVVLLAFLGVKFMMGSTEEKAAYKKSFMPLIIGLFIVLAATTLGSWIWNIFDGI